MGMLLSLLLTTHPGKSTRNLDIEHFPPCFVLYGRFWLMRYTDAVFLLRRFFIDAIFSAFTRL